MKSTVKLMLALSFVVAPLAYGMESVPSTEYAQGGVIVVAKPIVLPEIVQPAVNAGWMSSVWNSVKSFGLAVPGICKLACDKAGDYLVNAKNIVTPYVGSAYAHAKEFVVAAPGVAKDAINAFPGQMKTVGNKVAGAAVVSAAAIKHAGVVTVEAAKRNPKTAIAIGVGAAGVGYGMYKYLSNRAAKAWARRPVGSDWMENKSLQGALDKQNTMWKEAQVQKAVVQQREFASLLNQGSGE